MYNKSSIITIIAIQYVILYKYHDNNTIVNNYTCSDVEYIVCFTIQCLYLGIYGNFGKSVTGSKDINNINT